MAWGTLSNIAAGDNAGLAVKLQKLVTNLNAIGDPWTAYTPTITNWTQGNGTLNGRYMQAGKLVHFYIDFTVGTTTTPSGTLTFNLPAMCIIPTNTGEPLNGTAWVYDLSTTTQYLRFPTITTSGSIVHLRDVASALVTATVPFTWATGDRVVIRGSYEAA
jgi:hypothetical protein